MEAWSRLNVYKILTQLPDRFWTFHKISIQIMCPLDPHKFLQTCRFFVVFHLNDTLSWHFSTILSWTIHIWSYSGPHFPAFRQNTERYGASLRIHSEYGKIRTRKTPKMDILHAVIVAYAIYERKSYCATIIIRTGFNTKFFQEALQDF